MNISIVIAIFNEIDSLSELKNELINNLSDFNDWEVIFVDDGSRRM